MVPIKEHLKPGMTYMLYCVCQVWWVTSDFQEKVNRGSMEACHLALQLRTRQQTPATPIFHPCWSNYSDYNSGHMLNWNEVWEGGGGQASVIFKSLWYLAVVESHELPTSSEFDWPIPTASPDWEGKRDVWKARKPLDQTLLRDSGQSPCSTSVHLCPQQPQNRCSASACQPCALHFLQ